MGKFERGEVVIRGARFEDVAPLALTMRAEDRAEVWASQHLTPAEALEASLRHSVMAFTFEIIGMPAAMFGLIPGSIIGGRACVWLLTGEACDRIPVTFLKLSRKMISRFLELYPVMENWIDARYERAVKWARLCGAEVEDAAPWGAEGLPFHHVVFRRGD